MELHAHPRSQIFTVDTLDYRVWRFQTQQDKLDKGQIGLIDAILFTLPNSQTLILFLDYANPHCCYGIRGLYTILRSVMITIPHLEVIFRT